MEVMKMLTKAELKALKQIVSEVDMIEETLWCMSKGEYITEEKTFREELKAGFIGYCVNGESGQQPDWDDLDTFIDIYYDEDEIEAAEKEAARYIERKK